MEYYIVVDGEEIQAVPVAGCVVSLACFQQNYDYWMKRHEDFLKHLDDEPSNPDRIVEPDSLKIEEKKSID